MSDPKAGQTITLHAHSDAVIADNVEMKLRTLGWAENDVYQERMSVGQHDIRMMVGDKAVLRISADGFEIEGRPVQIDDLEEHDRAVYNVFKAWVLNCAIEEPNDG
jgi:hypothetical protein